VIDVAILNPARRILGINQLQAITGLGLVAADRRFGPSLLCFLQ
jgi:hypothetical protein